jgi:hypothetical protein
LVSACCAYFAGHALRAMLVARVMLVAPKSAKLGLRLRGRASLRRPPLSPRAKQRSPPKNAERARSASGSTTERSRAGCRAPEHIEKKSTKRG